MPDLTSAAADAGPERKERGETHRLRVDLAYRGDRFHGWQRQPGGLRTVQGVLEGALQRLVGHDGAIVAAGRTDAGVHARGQVCHVDARCAAEARRIAAALPGMMPDDVLVTAVNAVPASFDARFSAVARRYAYHLLLAPDLFRPFAWRIRWTLDRSAMDAAAELLRGEHDFASFCKKISLRENNRCRVTLCRFEWGQASAIFHVRADRFLHNMVRNMVGTLVEVGRGTRRPGDLPDILAARDRQRAGPTAPPEGLFLEDVSYPPELTMPGGPTAGTTESGAAASGNTALGSDPPARSGRAGPRPETEGDREP